MKNRIAIPVAAFVAVGVLTQSTALRPRGEISAKSATMCSQANGSGIVMSLRGTLMKTLVLGCKRKTASRTRFSAITGIHFRLMSSPKETAATVAGRKSRPMNTGGFPKNAIREPIITLKPPMYGPKISPYSGATMSDSENEAPEAPIIGTVGIILSTAYRAVNIDIIAISLVLGAFFVMLTMFDYLQH